MRYTSVLAVLGGVVVGMQFERDVAVVDCGRTSFFFADGGRMRTDADGGRRTDN